jgi:hypothetical protein
MDCKRDNNRLKSNAQPNPSTLKPSIKLSAKRIIMAFIISKKSPKVRMVTGRVRITRIGLTMKLSKLKTTATIIAVIYESTDTFGKMFANTTTAKALSNILIISFIIKNF